MRALQVLGETIATQPRNLKQFLARKIAILDQIIPAIENAVTTIDRADSDAQYLVRTALGYVLGERPYLPGGYELNLVSIYNLNDLRHNFQAIIDYGTNNFLQYAIGTLENVQPIVHENRVVLNAIYSIQQGLREYGYDPTDPATQSDTEYLAALDLADAYKTIAEALKTVETLIETTKTVLLDLQKRQRMKYNPDGYRPDHGEIETLYHATLYATEIARDGFAAEKPIDRQGVGNFGSQNTISFTHDLSIAHDIMRTLKEMWMIVHGQLKRHHILGWMHAEGIDPQKASMLLTPSEPVDSVLQTLRLYRGYLALSRVRSDPVIVNADNLVPILQNRDYDDIGIVSCQVRLDGSEEYLQGEAEFRVSPAQVVGPIRRIV